MGWAPAVGALAARHSHTAVCVLLLQCPGDLPAAGALADSVGGLAGARMLSLVFMLGATILVWSTTERLFGRRSAFFAAALFAVLGPTLQLGALATIAAPSVFLVALAAWTPSPPPGRNGEHQGPAAGPASRPAVKRSYRCSMPAAPSCCAWPSPSN